MYKWFFIASFIYVAASEDSLTFYLQKTTLANCIEHHLVNIDSEYESNQVANRSANLAATRFYGKSMSRYTFNERFNQFFNQLRKYKLNLEINEDPLMKRLKEALEKALITCVDLNSLTSKNTRIIQSGALNTITEQDDEWIFFSSNKYLLFVCLESYLKRTHHHEFHLKDGFIREITEFTVRRYYGKSMSKKNFNKRNRKFFYDLRSGTMHHEMEITSLSNEVESSVRQALENCAEKKITLVDVPLFKIEPLETAQLLNLILVRWPYNLRHMIQSRNSRRVLRSYAIDAWIALKRGLNVYHNNSQIFRVTLRSFWNNRAREMYDANSVEPYIVHRYTLNYPDPHMIQSNSDTFTIRQSISFSDRNPLVPRSSLNEILNIHRSDHSNNESSFDIFENYNNSGMTSAEYYFENQLDQFYRILFFFLELGAKGICTDKDDVFDGPLPKYLVSEKIQAITYDDDIYRDYLLDERFFYQMLMGNDTHNEIAQNLFRNARVLEENLILLRSYIPSTSGISPSSKSATTEKTTTTTTESLKRKDNIWKNENGKCFSNKRTKTFMCPDSSDNILNLNTENWNQVINFSFQENHNDILTVSTEKVSNDFPELDVSQELDDSNSNSVSLDEVTNLPPEKNYNYLVRDSTDDILSMNLDFSLLQEPDQMETHNLYGYMLLSDDDFNQMQLSYEEFFVS